MTTPNLKDYLQKLKEMPEYLAKSFPSYIFHIRFPLYKNISPNTRIDFTFPVTALTGANGSGKTSVLYALYGAPIKYSTGDYWFSTEVDPIEEGDGKNPNRFIYGHRHEHAKYIVETRKARVRKGKNPNYWEPTKSTSGDDMQKVPKFPGQKIPGLSADRWNPVAREVIYINFRRELSAFDKYFYFGQEPKGKKLRKKQDYIRRDAKILQKIIEKGDKTVKWRNKDTTIENELLTGEVLHWIKFILGREYASARYILHTLFKGKGEEGLSVQFKTAFGNYSEAFAGSGEIAVTSVVVKISKAKEGALVLLDEPEVSLHPGAQERLLIFLLHSAIKKKIQVIFSTHAPHMIQGLPDDAIKVFIQDQSGKFSVISNSHPHAAFWHLGAKYGEEIRILVEDRLAKSIVELALIKMKVGERKRFKADVHPGGADAILTYAIPELMQTQSNTFYLLDGDKKRLENFKHPKDIPNAEDNKLEDYIKEAVGVSPKFNCDGNDGMANEKQKIALQRKYLEHIHKCLHYLPARCPEEIVLNACPDLKPPKPGIGSSAQAKNIIQEHCKEKLGEEISAEDIDNYARFKLAEKADDSEEMNKIVGILTSIGKTAS